jgi:hypothetical protein
MYEVHLMDGVTPENSMITCCMQSEKLHSAERNITYLGHENIRLFYLVFIFANRSLRHALTVNRVDILPTEIFCKSR